MLQNIFVFKLSIELFVFLLALEPKYNKVDKITESTIA